MQSVKKLNKKMPLYIYIYIQPPDVNSCCYVELYWFTKQNKQTKKPCRLCGPHNTEVKKPLGACAGGERRGEGIAGGRVAGWGALPQSYTLRLSRWRHAPLVTQGEKVEEGEREEEAEEEEEQTRAGGWNGCCRGEDGGTFSALSRRLSTSIVIIW